MSRGLYVELVGPPGSGKSTFYESMARTNRDVVDIEYAAWETLAKTNILPIHLRFLSILFPARLSKIKSRKKYAKDWIETNCSIDDRNLLQAAIEAINELNTPRSQFEWLVNRQPVILATSHLAKRFALERKKIVIGDESVAQNIVSVFLARNTNNGIPPTMRRFIELAPKPDAVVYFRASPSILWDRINSRPKGMPNVYRGCTFDQFRTAAEFIDTGIASMREAFEQSGVTWYEITPDSDLRIFMDDLSHRLKHAAGLNLTGSDQSDQ